MISIITGTLNRKSFLPNLITNTVNSCSKLELVLVDGGSTDGTIDYIKNLNHQQITLIELGERSPYPHFMNEGIKKSKYEYICQWNDDVLLLNNWNDVINEIDDDNDFYIFNWKEGTIKDINNSQFIKGNGQADKWCICYTKNEKGEGAIVVNYGIYNKKIFREIGMYNHDYKYYYCDGDMSERAYFFGYNYKISRHIKVLSISTDKRAIYYPNDQKIYNNNLNNYKNKLLPKNIEYLV